MKKTGVMLAAVLAATMVMAQEKTAVVNMVDLVRFHPSRERDRKLMQDTEKEFQSKLDKQRDRFEQLRSDYEKAVKEARNPALNEKARAEAEDKAMKHRDVLAEADRDLRQEMQKLQRELGDLDTRLLRQVTGDIREVLSKFAQEGKYSIVLDGTTMAYFDPKLEVTDEVLRRMGVDPKVRKEAKEKAEKEKAAGKSAVEKK
ncbi:MAG: OmpH family outer membrane protein [Kiritimatiellae bacterium]|nr:OmpH family outer membrane protein [Kiritimatiellia bacterium]